MTIVEKEVVIPNKDIQLNGILSLSNDTEGVIIFAHGSGSSRLSPRNTYVARKLQRAGLGTLLMDLLSEEEEEDRSNVFDIRLLAERLSAAKKWLLNIRPSLKVGYFGASTGAAAALVAAARDPIHVYAVVSRGGRPDLAEDHLPLVTVPTLLIIGGEDNIVIDLNRSAYAELKCKKEIRIVPGATHLFEEPGTLEQVAKLASEWFVRQLEASKAKETAQPVLY